MKLRKLLKTIDMFGLDKLYLYENSKDTEPLVVIDFISGYLACGKKRELDLYVNDCINTGEPDLADTVVCEAEAIEKYLDRSVSKKQGVFVEPKINSHGVAICDLAIYID